MLSLAFAFSASNMYLISSRQDIWNDNKFSDYDRVTDSTGNVIYQKDHLLELCRDHPVMLLIHGYYSPRERLLRAYTKISLNLGPDYLVVGFTWPAGSRFYHYLTAKNRCPLAAFHLQQWIIDLSRAAAFLDVNTHSLGARVLFHALRDYGDVRVHNAYVLAPAVDDECLQAGEKFSAVPTKCQRLITFYSQHDPVLKWAYPANDFDKALGLCGPADESKIEADNVGFIDCTSIVSSHGGYKDRPEVYQVIRDNYGR